MMEHEHRHHHEYHEHHERHRHDSKQEQHGKHGQQKKHRHHRDSASIFKEKSLKWLERQKVVERYLKIALFIVAIIMAMAVIVVYKFL